MYATGDGSLGQLGLGHDQGVSKPQTIYSLYGKKHSIINICAGENHSLALDETGQLWAFGCNKYGQVCNFNDIQMFYQKCSLVLVTPVDTSTFLKRLKTFPVWFKSLVALITPLP